MERGPRFHQLICSRGSQLGAVFILPVPSAVQASSGCMIGHSLPSCSRWT